MPHKYIDLLNQQISKLDEPKFDLEAWKNYTIILLEKIFGSKTHKIQQIEAIKFDFSSWSLRDTTGKKTGIDACKEIGREILEASINELENFGIPKNGYSIDEGDVSIIIKAFENNLTVSQYKDIIKLIKSTETTEYKTSELISLLKSFGESNTIRILVEILVNPDFKEKIL